MQSRLYYEDKLPFRLEEQRPSLISSQANAKEDMLLNVKMRAINNWILERGLIVKLLDVSMYLFLCKLTINALNMAMLFLFPPFH